MPYYVHFFRVKSARWRHRAHIDSFAISSKNFRKIGIFRIAEYDFGFQILKLKMTVRRWRTRNLKIQLIRMKIGSSGFLRSLITNRYSKFQNSKWRIQYGGPIRKNLLDWDENYYSGIFEVSDWESALKI